MKEEAVVASRNPLVEVEHVQVSYHGAGKALDDFSLTLYAGEHTVIRGGNGAGKSTLLRLLRGEQWPDQIGAGRMGRVVWHTGEGPEEAPLAGRKMTALVSAAQQEKAVRQGWHVTGEELVLGGFTDTVYMQRRPMAEETEYALQLVRLLGGEKLLPREVTVLSQGQLRLLLIARALVRKPALLLLDEVTDGLDGEVRRGLLDALEGVAGLSTLVMTTHRPETLPQWVRREVTLAHGRLVEEAPEGESEVQTVERSTGNVFPGLRDIRGCRARIVISNASVFIDRVPVLHNISWTIEPGENWAVLGSNGAGKSTLLRLLHGDEIVAYGGSITHELPRQGGVVRRLEDLRRGVRLVSDLQQATYGYDVTGTELVFSGIDNAVGVYREASKREREQVRNLLHDLRLEFLADRPIRSCSTGELRRLLLARALAGEPDLLLLDEPFSGLDADSRAEFVSLLDQLARQRIQMVMVTHHETDIIPAITHMLQLEQGCIKAIWERKASREKGIAGYDSPV